MEPEGQPMWLFLMFLYPQPVCEENKTYCATMKYTFDIKKYF